MARFFGIASLLLLLLPFSRGGDVPLCSEYNVCVAFVNDNCKVQGQWTGEKEIGVVWEKEVCTTGNYKQLYAMLEFELRSADTWSVLVTTIKDSIVKDKFVLGKHGLTFPNETTAVLTLKSGKELAFSMKKMEGISRWFGIKMLATSFDQFNFTITMEGKKLVDVLGAPKMSYTSDTVQKTFLMNDKRFSELIAERAKGHCDKAILEKACYGGCEDMDISPFRVNCSSSLWVNPKSSFVRDWKPAEAIECGHGKWNATLLLENPSNSSQSNSSSFSFVLDVNYEIACATSEPAKMTGLAIGLASFGGIVLVIALIVIIFCVIRRKRGQNETRSESCAQTPGSSKKSTPGVYLTPPPEPQEPAGFEAAAGPPIPKDQKSKALY